MHTWLHCPVCADDRLPIWTRQPMSIAICEGCGLVFANPMLSDADKAGTDRSFRAVHRSRSAEVSWQQAFRKSLPRARRVVDLVAEHVAPGNRVLDIGCGDGAVIAQLQERGWRAEGLDPDVEAGEQIRTRLTAKVHTGSLEEAGFGEQRFDAVTMVHLVEHLFDPVARLKQTRDLLRPEGVLVLETPNVLRFKVGPRRAFSLAHNYHFSPRTMARTLWEAGFQTIAMRVFFRDSFQLVARPLATTIPCPRTDAAAEVRHRLNAYRWRYYASGQFVWRKLPAIRDRWLHRIVHDLSGPELAAWLEASPTTTAPSDYSPLVTSR